MTKKPHLNIVFIGHVDAGKSTTVGRILYETGAISEQTLTKLKNEAAKVGKATFEFAFVMDELKDERERGVTIDISHREFETNKYHYTIIDAPGHKDFVKNMITGASQADAAVLVISVKDGIQAQTREHAFLAKVLGINQLIINMNKMDAVNYDQAKFNVVKLEAEILLRGMGYKLENIQWIATSSYKGDNLTKKSENMPWYTGQTLLQALDNIVSPAKEVDKPLRLSVQEVFSITGHGVVPVGEVKTGKLLVNMPIIFMPSGKKGEVKRIEMHHKELNEALPGDNIGFNVKGIEKNDIKKGEVIGPLSNPPKVASEFTAQIVVLGHPTAISVGYTPVIHTHTTHFPGKVIELVEKKDPKTGQTIPGKPDFLKTGDTAIIKIAPTKSVVIEKFSDFPAFGRFVIRDMGGTVAAGIVLDVVEKKQ
ncbi:MAG: translation elongation factor EF-1 subunit alpha [Candidatus Micrarchaeota archaeon]